MSKYHSHINSAIAVISTYDGTVPFAVALRKFFASNSKYGSRDRKGIGQLCYSYLRVVRGLEADLTLEDKILISLAVCNAGESEILTALRPDWSTILGQTLDDKLQFFKIDATALFPFLDEVDTTIDIHSFCSAHLKQPALFLRIRPGHESTVIQKLTAADIAFTQVGSHGLSLANTTKIETLLDVNREVVIQDSSSQRVGEMLDLVSRQNPDTKLKVWDCCAASGGKTILAVDKLGQISLLVSDIRESILKNLKVRLKEARISNFSSKLIDLADNQQVGQVGLFDLVIADVPCTGSGTWSRTPERLTHFNESEIEKYTTLQISIVNSILPKVKKDGYLLYITCSVYRQENSDIVQYMTDNLGLELLQSETYIGYTLGADTMFAALLKQTVGV